MTRPARRVAGRARGCYAAGVGAAGSAGSSSTRRALVELDRPDRPGERVPAPTSHQMPTVMNSPPTMSGA